ncbi:hypothetical protein [Novosphingobium lentum]|uniref:hypothetical protein n=1 Tax=Novosphingobium lentum TaxID=145287 RepID=UPI000A77C559|nr:hypothetical protein [Novosphingobium lentum]
MRARIDLGVAAAAAAWLLAAATPAFADPFTLDAARRSEVGRWQGKLEYRDYQANTWFGLPVKVAVSDGGDGVTQVRTSDYDDGPKAGIVRITAVTLTGKDGLTLYSVSFRKGEVPEVSTSMQALDPASTDPAHWTVIETEQGLDDDRPATIRVTTRRDGNALTSLKEVRFTAAKAGETPGEWFVRNRTTLTRIPE